MRVFWDILLGWGAASILTCVAIARVKMTLQLRSRAVRVIDLRQRRPG